MAVPLFIFSATICRFVEERYHVPEHQLDIILQKPDMTASSQMEKIYLPILKHCVESSGFLKNEFRKIVGAIILLANPLLVYSLSRLLGIEERSLTALLDAFHSVLDVPRDTCMPVRILHLSFREFLIDAQEQDLRVNKKETYGKLLYNCLLVIKDFTMGLTQNICRLSSYRIQREDVDSHTISQHISQVLRYSCRYQAYHFRKSESDASALDVFTFLKEHFLHQLEAMSLIGLASETVGTINALRSELTVSCYLNGHLVATNIVSGKYKYRVGRFPTGCQPIPIEAHTNDQQYATSSLLFWTRFLSHRQYYQKDI